MREGVEQHVQIVDRRHRVVIFGQRHDRDARDLDRVAQAQRVTVFEVDRPDDVALPLLELLGVIARDGLDRRVRVRRDTCLVDLQKSDAIAQRGRHLVVIHKGEKFILLVHAAAIVDKNAGARHLAAHLILADLYGEKRLAEKRRASLRFKAQRQMECLPVRFVGELRALRVDDLSSVGKSNRRQCHHQYHRQQERRGDAPAAFRLWHFRRALFDQHAFTVGAERSVFDKQRATMRTALFLKIHLTAPPSALARSDSAAPARSSCICARCGPFSPPPSRARGACP